jgi:hypothetical protein
MPVIINNKKEVKKLVLTVSIARVVLRESFPHSMVGPLLFVGGEVL